MLACTATASKSGKTCIRISYHFENFLNFNIHAHIRGGACLKTARHFSKLMKHLKQRIFISKFKKNILRKTTKNPTKNFVCPQSSENAQSSEI